MKVTLAGEAHSTAHWGGLRETVSGAHRQANFVRFRTTARLLLVTLEIIRRGGNAPPIGSRGLTLMNGRCARIISTVRGG